MTNKPNCHHRKPRPTEFGAWLTNKREAAELKQQTLASQLEKKLGSSVDSGRICEWEQGQGIPAPDAVKALWEMLDPKGPYPPAPVLASTAIKAKAVPSGTGMLELTS